MFEIWLLTALLLDDPKSRWSAELLPPVRLEADGRPIDQRDGSAAPFMGDFDGKRGPTICWWENTLKDVCAFPNRGSNDSPLF